MGKVAVDLSMSLDGFITGPNDGPENGLGDGGERLHEWLYDLSSWRERHSLAGGQANRDAEILDEAFKNTGAIVVQQYLKAGLLDEIQIHLIPMLLGDGRRLFDQLDTQQIELETTRVIESPGVTHLRFNVVK